MIKLQILKYKNYIKLFVPTKIKKKANIPTKVGNTKNTHSMVNYYIIIILQKYGFILSRGLTKVFIRNLLKH